MKEPGNANAASRLSKAIGQAAQRSQGASGAMLGTVVQGTPTLTVELDTGQVVPQCAGPNGLSPGVRVLAHFINNGHDLAVQSLSSQSVAITKAEKVGGGNYVPLFQVSAGDWTAPAVEASPGRIITPQSGIYIVSALDGSGAPGDFSIGGSPSGTGTHEYHISGGSAVTVEETTGTLVLDLRYPYSNEA